MKQDDDFLALLKQRISDTEAQLERYYTCLNVLYEIKEDEEDTPLNDRLT